MATNSNNYVVAGKIASTAAIGALFAGALKYLDSKDAPLPKATQSYVDKHGDVPSLFSAPLSVRRDPEYQEAILGIQKENSKKSFYAVASIAAAAAGLFMTWRTPMVEKVLQSLGRSV